MLRRVRRSGSALLGFINHLLRADLRRSPVYRGIANVIIAWLLGTLMLAALTPLIEARGHTVPRWATWTIFAASLLATVLLRWRRWEHSPLR